MSTIAILDTYPCGYVQQGPGRERLILAHQEYTDRGTRARTVNFTFDDGSLLLGYVTSLEVDLTNDQNVASDKRAHQFTVELMTVDREMYLLRYNAHNRAGRVSVVIVSDDE